MLHFLGALILAIILFPALRNGGCGLCLGLAGVGLMLMSADGGTLAIILVTVLVTVIMWLLLHDDKQDAARWNGGGNNVADGGIASHEVGGTVDDVDYKEDRYVENENSEDWEDFEYEQDKKYR